jgi:hypothetical protein
VAGLREDDDDDVDVDDDFPFYYPWEEHWLRRMGFSDCPVIQFDAGFNRASKDRDILSPGWFDRLAKRLLDKVKSKREVKYYPWNRILADQRASREI